MRHSQVKASLAVGRASGDVQSQQLALDAARGPAAERGASGRDEQKVAAKREGAAASRLTGSVDCTT